MSMMYAQVKTARKSFVDNWESTTDLTNNFEKKKIISLAKKDYMKINTIRCHRHYQANTEALHIAYFN